MEITNFNNGSMKLVIYDISNNKKRNKFAKLLSEYGIRVQKSAFEIDSGRGKFMEMLESFAACLEAGDSIRLYPESCNVKTWGKSSEIVCMDSFIMI